MYAVCELGMLSLRKADSSWNNPHTLYGRAKGWKGLPIWEERQIVRPGWVWQRNANLVVLFNKYQRVVWLRGFVCMESLVEFISSAVGIS